MIRGAAVTVVLAGALSACHFGAGTGTKQSGSQQHAGSTPSTPPVSPSLDDKLGRLRTSDLSSTSTLKALYPGNVRLSLASDPNAASTNANCASDVNFDVVVSTDGSPVAWRAATSDNSDIYLGYQVGGFEVTPKSGVLQGGETATVHVSGGNYSFQTFWIAAMDVQGGSETLEVDCVQ
jgi:hypothetical protein